MNWFIDTITLAITIWDTTQARTRQKPNASWNNARLITDDVSKQIACNNNTIQSLGVLDHQHSRTINEMMPNLELRVILRHNLSNHLPPQSRCRQHIRFVQTPHWQRWIMLQRKMSCKSCNPLNFRSGIWLGVPSCPVPIIFFPCTEIDSARQLANDVEIGTTADFGFEGGYIDKRVGGKITWAEVAESAHLFAEGEETLLGADGTSSPFGAADGSQEDSISSFGSSKGFCCQWFAGGVD